MTLAVGDAFPSVAAKDREGNDVDIATMAGDGWGVVLFYRGDW